MESEESLASHMVLPGISCLFLGEVPELLVSCFPDLQNGDNINVYLVRLCEG